MAPLFTRPGRPEAGGRKWGYSKNLPVTFRRCSDSCSWAQVKEISVYGQEFAPAGSMEALVRVWAEGPTSLRGYVCGFGWKDTGNPEAEHTYHLLHLTSNKKHLVALFSLTAEVINGRPGDLMMQKMSPPLLLKPV